MIRNIRLRTYQITQMKTAITTLYSCILLLFVSGNAMAVGKDSTLSSIQLESFHLELSTGVIQIKFTVASEKSGKLFHIEKSLDEKSWSPIMTFFSIGDHRQPKTYESSIVDFPEASLEHYRLVRVDISGDTTILESTIIRREGLKNIQLTPVEGKAHKEVTLTFESMNEGEGILTVMKRNGEIIHDEDISIVMGYNRLKLRIKDYEKGNYLVTIRDTNDNKISKRLVVYK